MTRFTLTGQESATLTDGTITVNLPGLIAIRIDTRTRTIAIDGISGEACRAEPLLPEWFVADLRDGTYGGFHRLSPREECFDRDCADSGQHNALYPHVHQTIEETGDCRECMDRAADLRVLSGD